MKKRAANFTPEEKSELLDAVLRHREVLFGRVGLPSRYWAAKKAAWCDIVDAVNKVRPSPGRNVHECRRKLKDLKAATRKKFMDVNGAWRNDVDVKEATPEELKILKLLGNDEKPADAPNMDLSIIKIESDAPNIVNVDAELENNQTSEVDVEPEIIFETIPSTSPPHKVIPPSAPVISIIPQATLKVEPMKRPIGQVLPLSLSENQQSLNLNQNQDVQSQVHGQTLGHPLNLTINTSSSASGTSPTNLVQNQSSHVQDQGQALNQSQLISQNRKTSRNHAVQSGQGQSQNQARPFAEFAAPVPLKRIKLFVRNVPTLTQPTTSVGPTANGNVLNFAICSCNKHAGHKRVQEVGVQTEETDVNRMLLNKIVETQRMTAKALTSLEYIAQSARMQGLVGKSNLYNTMGKVEKQGGKTEKMEEAEIKKVEEAENKENV